MMMHLKKKYISIIACSAWFSLVGMDLHAADLFNTSERESTNISAFNKWTRMLKRNPGQLKKLDAECIEDEGCKKSDWEDMLDSLSGDSAMEQIRSVNRYINKSPYVKDIVNWGMEDYWETLFEFFTKNGDCEDYAIAKYLSLKKLGFNEDDLRIVILKDQNLRVMHAVLAVYEGDRIYILDNQSTEVLEDKRIHHYQPVYSINQHAWWRHLP